MHDGLRRKSSENLFPVLAGVYVGGLLVPHGDVLRVHAGEHGRANCYGTGKLLSGSTLVGFMSNSFYAVMAIIFPMSFAILMGNGLIAAQVDRGTMTCYLSTPVGRNRISVTSALCMIFYIVMIWVVASIVGLIVAELAQPDELDRAVFLKLNLGAVLYHLAVGGICFLASCIFNRSSHSLVLGCGLPLFFFVMNLLLKLSEDLEVLKYFTMNTLFDTQAVVSGGSYGWKFAAMGLIAAVCYMSGIVIFRRKDLPI